MNRRKIGLLLIMIACLGIGVFTACKDTPPESTDDSSGSITDDSSSIDLVELEDYEANIQTGESVQIEVLNWENEISYISQNPNIATVDENGLVVGVTDGETIIEVVCGGDTLMFTVNVSEALKDAVNFRLATNSSQIYVGYQLTLNPILIIGGNLESISNYTVTYESSNSNVATVSDGVITGVADGETVITACVTIEDVQYEAKANLSVIEIAAVILEKEATTISKEGTFQTEQLSYTYKKYEQGAFVETENPTLPVWTSSDNSIVTVDNDGELTGISAGKATVTVVIGKASATCEVTVYDYYAKIFDVNGFLDIGNHLDGHFELMNDIDCSGTVFENPFGYTNEIEAGPTKYDNYDTYSIPFTGHLDGNGYSVRNITHAMGAGDERFERAIFTNLSKDAIVENIGFDITNSNTTAVMAAGVACMNYGTIRNVAVNMTLSGVGTSYNHWGSAGITNLNYGVISSCVANINALNGVQYSGTVCLGGIINTNRAGKLSACLAVVNSDEVLVYSHSGSWGTVSGCAVASSASKIVDVFDKALLSSSIWNTTGDVLPTLKTDKQTIISDKIIYTGLNGDAGICIDMEGETVLSAAINGKDVAYSIENGAMLISSTELSGDMETVDTLIVQTSEAVYLYQIRYIANEIETGIVVEYDKSTGKSLQFSIADITGNIERVNIGGTTVDFSVSECKLTISADALTDIVGEKLVSLNTSNATYNYSAIFVTRYLNAENVTSYAELKALLEADMNGYYVLTSNIDLAAAGNNSQRATRAIGFGAVSSTTHTGYTEFNGTIDGRGYAIQNLEYNWRADGGNHDHAFIDVIGANGVIKNIAFTNVKAVVSGARIAGIAWTNKGTIENCYIDYTNSAGVSGQNAEWGQAVIALINEGMVKDCITKLTTTATTGSNRLAIVTNNTGTVTNVNAIVDIISDVDPVVVFVDSGSTADSACSTTVSGFYAANGDAKYTSAYWTFDEANATVSFGETVVL